MTRAYKIIRCIYAQSPVLLHQTVQNATPTLRHPTISSLSSFDKNQVETNLASRTVYKCTYYCQELFCCHILHLLKWCRVVRQYNILHYTKALPIKTHQPDQKLEARSACGRVQQSSTINVIHLDVWSIDGTPSSHIAGIYTSKNQSSVGKQAQK